MDQKGSAWTNEWKYYPVSTIYERAIETCEVEFPSLKDKRVPTQHLWIVGFRPIWRRPMAYLAAHQGTEAAVEFQKVLDHRGIVIDHLNPSFFELRLCVTYILVHSRISKSAEPVP